MLTASPASDQDIAGTARLADVPAAPVDPRKELLRQSAVAQSLGSPFVSEVLAATFRQLWRAPELDAQIAQWPLDPASSAMALRLNAGLHALARRGTFADLTGLYQGAHQEFDRAIGEALQHGEPTLLVWMGHPTQTNEVRRSSAFMAALAVLAREHGMPFELFEIGASAGLNLLLDRYAHDLGGAPFGDPQSPLHLRPQWEGFCPPRSEVRINAARGVDLRPLSLHDPHTRERLMSYIWPGDTVRADCLQRAMTIAHEHMPVVDRASASTWLAEHLREPQPANTVRVIQHSMVLQYLPPEELNAVKSAVLEAGNRASAERPLARIGLEWNRKRTTVVLCMTRWSGTRDDGSRKILAQCHPYGGWMRWYGPPTMDSQG